MSNDVVGECSSHVRLGHDADKLVSVDDRKAAYPVLRHSPEGLFG